MRTSREIYVNARAWTGYDCFRLWEGYDDIRQAWVKNGRYVRCGHPPDMPCNCYGRLHAGEETVLSEEGKWEDQ